MSKPQPSFTVQLLSLFGFLLLYSPLAVLVVYSFLGQQGQWTLQWYYNALGNEEVLEALKMSLWIGFWSTLGATLIGSAGAYAFVRYRFPMRKVFDAVGFLPIVMPEIVFGLSLLVWLVWLRIELGPFATILAHTTFSSSYVLLSVKTRLQGLESSLEEAAKDLGAGDLQTFLFVTLPLITPAIVSGALMAFTLSFDDFLITFFTSGAGSETLPLKIYSMIRYGVSPEIHALSTLILLVTLILVIFFFNPFELRKLSKKNNASENSES